MPPVVVAVSGQGYTGLACDQCLTGFTEVSTGVCQLLDVAALVDTTSGVVTPSADVTSTGSMAGPSPSPSSTRTPTPTLGQSTASSSKMVLVIAVAVGVGCGLLAAVVGGVVFVRARQQRQRVYKKSVGTGMTTVVVKTTPRSDVADVAAGPRALELPTTMNPIRRVVVA